MSAAMNVKGFFDELTFTLTYVVWHPQTGDAVVIDPVLDFDPLLWRVSNRGADEVATFCRDNSLKVRWILDSHAHADHLTGMRVLRERFGAPTAIGEQITAVQQLFAPVFEMGSLATDGRQWDTLLTDGQRLEAGAMTVEAIHTPGHTPACMSFKIGDAVFTGDAVFMPDYGTGRCDFPKGSAEDLYDSVTKKLYTLPDATRVFVGHDYMPGGRELAFETTIGASKRENKQLRATTSRADFLEVRNTRDATLAPPKLILQSLQVNVAAGELPAASANGRRYFTMPINFLGT